MTTMYISTDQISLTSSWKVSWDEEYHRKITIGPSTASAFRTFAASALPAGSEVLLAVMTVTHTAAPTGGTCWANGEAMRYLTDQIDVTDLFQCDQEGNYADFAVEFKWKANGSTDVTSGIKYSTTQINAQIAVTYEAGSGREYDPEAYHEAAIADARQIRPRMMITYADGSTQPVGEDMILRWEINEGNDDGVLLGTCTSARLDLSLANPGGEWFMGGSMRGYRELYGAKASMEIGLLVDGEWIYNKAGTYVIEEFSGTENEPAMELSGYDEMSSAMEEEFRDELTYPATLAGVLAEVIRNAGVGVEGVLAANNTCVIPKKPDWGDKCTIRRALAFVCAAGGSYARVTRQGTIGISNAWKETPLIELTPDNYMDNDYDERVFTFNRVVVTPRGAQNSETTIQAAVSEETEELPSNTLYIDDNPLFVQGQQIAQTMANGLCAALEGAVWANMHLRWRGNPEIEIGTRISCQDTRGITKTTTIMAQKMAWDFGFDSTAVCMIDTHEITKTGAVTGGGMIDTKKIALEGIGGGLIATEAIASKHLQTESVTADKIDAGAVTTEKLDAGAVTAEKLEAGAVTTEKLDAGAVTTEKLDAGSVTAAKLAAGAVEAGHLSAGALEAVDARINAADIGFAQIKDAVIEQLITKDALSDRYYIRKLQVDNLQTIDLTVGNLVVKAKDGNYYALDVDSTGAVTATQRTVTASEIAAGVTADGSRSIIETDLLVTDLAATNIKGVNALLDKIMADRINVNTLFARQATINRLNATDISNNQYLRLMVDGKLDGMTVGGRNYLRNSSDLDYSGYYLAGEYTRNDPYIDYGEIDYAELED